MNRPTTAGIAFGFVLALGLGNTALAGDDATKQQYKDAKEACERLSGDEQDRCEEKAKADYKRHKESDRRSEMPERTHDRDEMMSPQTPGAGDDMR